MHQVLAICPRLRWLGAGYVVLKDANGELFGDGMEPHASLRAIVLPMAACAHLVAYVDRLCTHCPALKETDADVVLDQADLVASCARRAAAAGVRRFICNSFFQGVGDSDGGSVGEYCGTGDVINYVARGGDGGGGGYDDE
jgi:hypothetical protein